MDKQKPSIGRIVHYVSRGSKDGVYKPECRAAIITAVYIKDELTGEALESPVVSVCVLNPQGIFFDEMVSYSGEKEGGTCHWPERTE